MNKDAFKIILPLAITVAVIFLAWKLSTVILLLITALLLSSALRPLVEILNKKLPLALSVVIVVLCLFLPIIGLVASVVPGLIRQAPDVVTGINNALHNTKTLPEALQGVDLNSYTQNAGKYLLQSTGKITNLLVSFLTLLVMIVYILIDSKSLKKLFLNLFPKDKEAEIDELLENISTINGHYIRGNLLISLICGIVIFIGLLILGVPYAAPLALFAAIFDLLPLAGAIIAAVPAVILAFTISPTVGIGTIILFVVYQQIENYFVGPNVYKQTLEISPGLSFLTVLIGATLLGVPGAFLALPIAATIPSLIKYSRKQTT